MGQNDSKSSAKSIGFIIVSSLVHIGLAGAVVSMNMDSKPVDSTEMEVMMGNNPEATEVEIAGGGAAAPVTETQTETQVEAASQEVVAAQAPAPVAATVAKAVATPTVKAAVAAPSEEAAIQTTEAAISEEAQQLDSAAAEAAPVPAQTAELPDDAISEELDKVDQENQAKQAAQLKEEAAKATAAAIAAEQIKKQEEEKAQNLAAQAAADEEAKAAKANEEAAAAAKLAEQAQAEQNAKLAAAAAAAAAAEEAKSANDGAATGAGTAAVTEIPKDVRSIEELKQKPGNPRPMYSSEDRLKGRSGEVAFLAYVSKEGEPVQFKMLQSSGHRELDAKTLKALKNWKFHPGQEGWVEIPFKWDLKGGPQEMPAQLRRAKVSVTN